MIRTAMYKRLSGVVAALAFVMMIPGVASAVTVNISGNIDTAFNLAGGPPPFSVGDPVSGSFNVDVSSDNSFNLDSLSNFSLTAGPATFDLNPSDFTQLSGTLSADGSTVSQLFLNTYAVDVGQDVDYGLSVQGPPNLIYVTNSGIIHAPITTTVSAESTTAVPAPGSLTVLVFALSLIGFGTLRNRRKS